MYATLQDMIDRFGEREILLLTDVDNHGIIGHDKVDRALLDASGRIDGYLTARYKLPLETVPVSLARVCADIARFYLYDDQPPEAVTQLYRDALDWLKSVAKGEANLGLSVDGGKAETADLAQMESGGRVWDRAKSKGFI